MRQRHPHLGSRPRTAAAGAPTYQGLGDLLGAAVAYWGLRAYTLASIGANAVDISRSGGSLPGTSTFKTVAGGGIDVAGIAAFKAADGSTQLNIEKIYDQTGHGNDLIASHSGVYNAAGLTGPLGALPSLDCQSTFTTQYFTAGSFTMPALPFTMVAVAKHVTSTSAQVLSGNTTGASAIIYRPSANNQVTYYNGGSYGTLVTCNDGTFNSLIANFTSPSTASFLTLNGADSATADSGSVSGGSGQQSLSCDPGGGQLFDGSFMELGIWAGGTTLTVRGNVYSQHHTYFGV